MNNKIISDKIKTQYVNFLGYDISVSENTGIIIKPNKDAFVFDINISNEYGKKRVLSLVSRMIQYQNVGLKFDMMCYSTPLNDKENEHLLRGVYIIDSLRNEGLLKPLLKMFLMINRNINKTHPDCEIPLMHYTLMEHFGFKPAAAEEKSPNVIYFPKKKSYYRINENYRIPYNFYEGLIELSKEKYEEYKADPYTFGEAKELFVEKQLFRAD